MRYAGFLLVLFAAAGTAAAEAGPVSVSTERAEVEIALYQNGLGLVKESRRAALAGGSGMLRVEGVPSSILPETVMVNAAEDPDSFSVVEQVYDYDLLNSESLMRKYEGRDIQVVRWNEYHDRKETVSATLLSAREGGILKIEDKIYLNYPGIKVFPELPGGLVTEPALSWRYLNEGPQERTLIMTYLASGMNWKPDYVLLLDAEAGLMRLEGWATLENHSGTSFPEASFRLVAGEVNRESRRAPAPMMRAEMAAMSFKADAAAETRAFSEYHIFQLPGKTALADRQSKQALFMSAVSVPVERAYEIGASPYYGPDSGAGDYEVPVHAVVRFHNVEEAGLGVPLAAGTARIYEQDKGMLLFAGEDRLGFTAEGGRAELTMGQAFDVTAKRRQTDFKRLTTQLFEKEMEISITNRRQDDIMVEVLESLPSDWKMLEHSHPYEPEDAGTLRFKVPVPAGETAVLRYRIQAGI